MKWMRVSRRVTSGVNVMVLVRLSQLILTADCADLSPGTAAFSSLSNASGLARIAGTCGVLASLACLKALRSANTRSFFGRAVPQRGMRIAGMLAECRIFKSSSCSESGTANAAARKEDRRRTLIPADFSNLTARTSSSGSDAQAFEANTNHRLPPTTKNRFKIILNQCYSRSRVGQRRALGQPAGDFSRPRSGEVDANVVQRTQYARLAICKGPHDLCLRLKDTVYAELL
jgi:hypothetical protein